MWELLFLCLFAVSRSRDITQVCFNSHFFFHFTVLICYWLYILIPDQGDDKSPAESEVNVEVQRCGAYKVVRLSQQRVTMKDNPAYVDVNLRNIVHYSILDIPNTS